MLMCCLELIERVQSYRNLLWCITSWFPLQPLNFDHHSRRAFSVTLIFKAEKCVKSSTANKLPDNCRHLSSPKHGCIAHCCGQARKPLKVYRAKSRRGVQRIEIRAVARISRFPRLPPSPISSLRTILRHQGVQHSRNRAVARFREIHR